MADPLRHASASPSAPPPSVDSAAGIETQGFIQDVFISYSRKDTAFVIALERALKAYKPPKDLRVPQRFLRVFRDVSDIRGVDYEIAIENHLRTSAKLVVVCSPNACASEYVPDEIKRFARLRGGEHIIPVLLSGLPNNEATGEREADKAFPDELYAVQRLPLATSDYRGRFNSTKDTVSKGVCEGPWFALLANIYDKERSEVEQREKKRQARTRNYTIGAVTAIGAILAVALIITWLSRDEAVRQRDIAETARERADRAAAQEKEAKEKEEIQRQKAENAQQEAERQRDFAREQQRIAEERRRLAESRQLAANAMAQLSADPELSTLLAVEAAKLSPTGEAAEALRRSLPDLYLQKTLRGHEYALSTAVASPNGARLVTADGYGSVGIWDGATGRLMALRREHTSKVMKAAISANGTMGATASTDGTARLWELRSARPIANVLRHTGAINDLAFNSDGTFLATASNDGAAHLWRLGAELELAQVLQHGVSVGSVQFSPDGKWLVTASADSSVRVWDLSIGKSMTWVRLPEISLVPAFTRDGRYVVQALPNKPAQVWEVADPQKGWAAIKQPSPLAHPQVSPDGSLYVTYHEHLARVWDMLSGQLVAELRGHADVVRSAVFSPDGRWILTSSGDRTARLWSTSHWGTVSVLRGHADRVYDAQFAADGASIITAGDSTARIWLVDGNRAIVELAGHRGGVRQVAFDSTGQFAITASDDKTIGSWFALNGTRTPASCAHDNNVMSIQLSRDARHLLSASFDKTARVWRWTPFSCVPIANLRGHHDVITSAVFSPDQKYVATASGDRTARIWDWVQEKTLYELRGHGNIVTAVAYSPNGRRL